MLADVDSLADTTEDAQLLLKVINVKCAFDRTLLASRSNMAADLAVDLLTVGDHPGIIWTNDEEKVEAFNRLEQYLIDFDKLPISALSLPSSADQHSFLIGRALEHISVTVQYRTFIEMDTGHIGVGPKIAQQGDFVAIFSGSTFPSIVRRHGDQYKFVGAAYIPGLMHGEIFEMGIESTWIDLR